MDDVERRWQVSSSMVQEWLMYGQLQAHIWIPLMSVYQMKEAEATKLFHWEGYAPISRHQCRRLFKNKRISIREFTTDDGKERFVVPDTAEDVFVELDDLVILKGECLRFEQRYIAVTAPGAQNSSKSNLKGQSFKTVHFNGEHFHFGKMQSAVLKYLYEAYLAGEPWQNGKMLLSQIGSQSFTVANLFKRQPIWRELIESDRRGSYRLSDAVLSILD